MIKFSHKGQLEHKMIELDLKMLLKHLILIIYRPATYIIFHIIPRSLLTMKYILQAHKQKARLEVERWHAPSATGKHAHLPTYMTYNSLGVHYSMKTTEIY